MPLHILQKKALLIEKYIESYGVVTWACNRSKITRQQFYNWLEEDKDFAKRISEADETIQDNVEKMYLDKDLPKDFQARKFWLERRTQKYKPKQDFDLTGDIEFDYKKSYGREMV